MTKNLLLRFRNRYLLILQTSSRAACRNKASLGKDGINPLIATCNMSYFCPARGDGEFVSDLLWRGCFLSMKP